jgi:hypothetical protein
MLLDHKSANVEQRPATVFTVSSFPLKTLGSSLVQVFVCIKGRGEVFLNLTQSAV